MSKVPLKLYALICLNGQDGPFHSLDYPEVRTTLKAAQIYRKEIPEVQRSLYQIVEFRAIRTSEEE